MKILMDISGYKTGTPQRGCAHAYLLPALWEILNSATERGLPKRLFELGCGNGFVANQLHEGGFDVTGCDPSSEGFAHAGRRFPYLKLFLDSSETDLARQYGRFPLVISLEVIEHVYSPRQFARRIYDLLEADGLAIISTPYHGYLKNLALALAGKMDEHFTALWDCGHIKFWSMKTLTLLLEESGFREIRFRRVGRVPPLAKSMIVTARRRG